MLFKHKELDLYLRLVKQTDKNVNTYLEVDSDNEVIIKKRSWHQHPQEQTYIMIGFDKLIKL